MKVEIHGKICDGIKDTYKAKNADYGNSFAKVRKEYPEAICIRLMDKLERLKVLVAGNKQQVKDESVEDTLLDMANYCIMEVVERRLDGMKGHVYTTGWHGGKKLTYEGKDVPEVQEIVDELLEPMDRKCAKACYWNKGGICEVGAKNCPSCVVVEDL